MAATCFSAFCIASPKREAPAGEILENSPRALLSKSSACALVADKSLATDTLSRLQLIAVQLSAKTAAGALNFAGPFSATEAPLHYGIQGVCELHPELQTRLRSGLLG